jgi:hypothetical protein
MLLFPGRFRDPAEEGGLDDASIKKPRPVLGRSDSESLFEAAGEVAFILDSNSALNLFEIQEGAFQQLFGFAQSQALEILRRGNVSFTLEEMTKMASRKIYMIGKVIDI